MVSQKAVSLYIRS